MTSSALIENPQSLVAASHQRGWANSSEPVQWVIRKVEFVVVVIQVNWIFTRIAKQRKLHLRSITVGVVRVVAVRLLSDLQINSQPATAADSNNQHVVDPLHGSENLVIGQCRKTGDFALILKHNTRPNLNEFAPMKRFVLCVLPGDANQLLGAGSKLSEGDLR